MRPKYSRERVDYLLKQPREEENVEELITLNFGLIRHQLNKFYLQNDPEALSISYEALYNAIMTFDTNRNNRFSTYATVCIYNALGSYVRSKKNQVEEVSYHATTEEGLQILDVLESGDTADGRLLDECGVLIIRLAVSKAVGDIMNPLHWAIVSDWIFSDYVKTHASIAEDVGCSQSYVSQVIKKFKSAVKDKLEGINNE